MEFTREFSCVIALMVVILSFITITLTLENELSKPDSIILFHGDDDKLQVDYKTQDFLDLSSKSLRLYFHEEFIDMNTNNCTRLQSVNKHYLRSFLKTEKNNCLDFDHRLPIYHYYKLKSIGFCVDTEYSTWHGGFLKETWPLNYHTGLNRPFVTHAYENQSVIESYFFNSHGFYFHIDELVPLFISIGTNDICFTSLYDEPYYYKDIDKKNSTEIFLKFRVCKYNNTREAHENATKDFLGKPMYLPDNYKSMVKNPIWSIRAKYGLNVNSSILQNYVNQIKTHNFTHGTFEIEDPWENCICSTTYLNGSNFENLKGLVKNFTDFKFSLWISPLISEQCKTFCDVDSRNEYFVGSESNKDVVKTWSKKKAYYVDFTNPDASYWWGNATRNFLTEVGIDTSVFVGGETNWYPKNPSFHDKKYGDTYAYPENINAYLETMIRVGNATHFKSSRRGQKYGHFLRLLNYNNPNKATKSKLSANLVSSVINSNMLGYPLVVPDIIIGNNTDTVYTEEMCIRWMQAVTFMPVVQYSCTPWDFGETALTISKKMMKLREEYIDTIIELVENSVANGSPVNPPIWWIDPTNSNLYDINDEYLLGENILVAPILSENTWYRNITLPKGTWTEGIHPNTIHNGPKRLENYYAKLDELPYFIKKQKQDSSDEENVLLLAAAIDDEEQERHKRRKWVHEINTKRDSLGEFNHLIPQLRKDAKRFFIFHFFFECHQIVLMKL